MAKCLYVVSTPLQLLNAIEARDRFNSEGENVLAVVRTALRGAQQGRQCQYIKILEGLVDSDWSGVWFPKMSRTRQALFSLVASSFVRRNRRCDTIYTGNFQSQQNHLINSISHGNLVLLDDGVGVHAAASLLRHESGRRRIVHRILGKRGELPAHRVLDCFTCFDVKEGRVRRVVKNDYRMMRAKGKRRLPVRHEEAVFISQPLHHHFGVQVKHELLRNYITQTLGLRRLRYFAHPRESASPPWAESPEYPVELFGWREGYLPGAFVTYFSSAARTLALLYETPVYCLEFPATVWQPASVGARLEIIYREYRDAGAIVVRAPSSLVA